MTIEPPPLQSRLVMASALGAAFGPLSYLAGSAAGAVEIVQPAIVYLALSIGWAILLPGLVLLARQLDGTRPPVIHSRI